MFIGVRFMNRDIRYLILKHGYALFNYINRLHQYLSIPYITFDFI